MIENTEDQQSSPRFNGAATKGLEDDDLLCDLGNSSLDEGIKASKPVVQVKPKKLKQRPTPHYLTGTAASRAM